MTLALAGKSKRRKMSLLVSTLLAVIGASLAAVALVLPAFAHSQSIKATCTQVEVKFTAFNSSGSYNGGKNETHVQVQVDGGPIATYDQEFTGTSYTFTQAIAPVSEVKVRVYWYKAELRDNWQNFDTGWKTYPVSCATPTKTATPTNTPVNTPTPTNTPVNTPTPTNTPVNTPTPTNTPVNTPTPTNTPANTPTPTNTPVNTPTPTNTPVLPTPTPEIPTPTPEDPTATPVPPTATPVPTEAPNVIDPTATPTEVSAEAGVRTGPTPIAPRTGAGDGGATGAGGVNLLLVLAGLAGLSGGTTLAVAGKRRR